MNSFIQNKSNFLKKVLIFFISVAIHSIFLYYFFHIKIYYKIYHDQKEVVEAIIVPKEPIIFPRVEEILESASEQREYLLSRNSRQIGPGAKAGQREQGGFQESSTGSQSETGEPQPGQGGQIINKNEISELTSGFGLAVPQAGGLDLSRYSVKKENKSLEPEPARMRRNLNLPQLLYPGFIYSHPARGSYSGKSGKTSARGAAGQMSQKARAYVLNLEGYDLAPWADKAMNQILKNWVLPSEFSSGAKGEVGISVVIEKDGKVSSAEVVVSSKIDVLDQAALMALQLSSPLPGLPNDFPAQNLEVYFVFEYGQ